MTKQLWPSMKKFILHPETATSKKVKAWSKTFNRILGTSDTGLRANIATGGPKSKRRDTKAAKGKRTKHPKKESSSDSDSSSSSSESSDSEDSASTPPSPAAPAPAPALASPTPAAAAPAPTAPTRAPAPAPTEPASAPASAPALAPPTTAAAAPVSAALVPAAPGAAPPASAPAPTPAEFTHLLYAAKAAADYHQPGTTNCTRLLQLNPLHFPSNCTLLIYTKPSLRTKNIPVS